MRDPRYAPAITNPAMARCHRTIADVSLVIQTRPNVSAGPAKYHTARTALAAPRAGGGRGERDEPSHERGGGLVAARVRAGVAASARGLYRGHAEPDRLITSFPAATAGSTGPRPLPAGPPGPRPLPAARPSRPRRAPPSTRRRVPLGEGQPLDLAERVVGGVYLRE